MRVRIGGLLGLVAGLTVAALGAGVYGQAGSSKPTWVYAHDLRVRKGGATDFGPDTPKVGIEFFKDDTGGGLVALTQAGHLAVAPVGTVGADKKATWLFAHDLRVRRSDEEKFTRDTAKFGIEVFKDPGSGKLLYVSEKLTCALADAPAMVGTDKDPGWHHGLILKVRGPGEKEFTATTRKYGVEVFKDGNTGGLIYISETGSLSCAAAPAQPPAPDKVQKPAALYGLELRVRKADEPDFGPNTRRLGVEVFRDENTGSLVYISETGSIACAPTTGDVKGGGKGVTWKHAMTLKARPGGVSEFAKANRYGIEVFEDNNTRHLIYACAETGSIAVLPRK